MDTKIPSILATRIMNQGAEAATRPSPPIAFQPAPIALPLRFLRPVFYCGAPMDLRADRWSRDETC